MKRTIVLAFMAVCTLALHAQLYVGGSFGFTSSKTGEASSANLLTVSPEIGYNFNPTWAIGTTVDYQSDLDDISNFCVSPYARVLLVRAGSVGFFTDAVVGFGSVKEYGQSQSYWKFALRPGVMANVSDRVSLLTSMNLFQYLQAGDLKNTTFGINNVVRLGLVYHF